MLFVLILFFDLGTFLTHVAYDLISQELKSHVFRLLVIKITSTFFRKKEILKNAMYLTVLKCNTLYGKYLFKFASETIIADLH